LAESERFFDFAEPKMPFASVSRFVYLRISDPTAAAGERNRRQRPVLSFEPNPLRRH
jgi:hypothetical protein